MANLPESSEWSEGIYQLETSDPVLGGPEGIDNLQAKQLAARTRWLKEKTESHSDSLTEKADKATTLGGYGITDAFTKPETSSAIQQAIASLVASSPAALDTLKELADALDNDPNFATTMTNALAAKASKATTLGGYGITDAFTKPETTSAIQQAIATLVASSPAALDTLKELADALGNDPNFATTMTNALSGKASIASIQSQGATAFTTAGAAPALTLTPSPAIAAYAANQRFRVKFGSAATGSDTLNVSGIGPKPLKQYDSNGAKVAAAFAVGHLSDVEYDGTDLVLLDQLPASIPQAVTQIFKSGQLLARAAGYQPFPGGLVKQWGAFSYTAAGSQTLSIPLPIAFQNQVLSASVTTGSRLNNTAVGIDVGGSTKTTALLASITASGSGENVVYYEVWGN